MEYIKNIILSLGFISLLNSTTIELNTVNGRYRALETPEITAEEFMKRILLSFGDSDSIYIPALLRHNSSLPEEFCSALTEYLVDHKHAKLLKPILSQNDPNLILCTVVSFGLQREYRLMRVEIRANKKCTAWTFFDVDLGDFQACLKFDCDGPTGPLEEFLRPSRDGVYYPQCSLCVETPLPEPFSLNLLWNKKVKVRVPEFAICEYREYVYTRDKFPINSASLLDICDLIYADFIDEHKPGGPLISMKLIPHPSCIQTEILTFRRARANINACFDMCADGDMVKSDQCRTFLRNLGIRIQSFFRVRIEPSRYYNSIPDVTPVMIHRLQNTFTVSLPNYKFAFSDPAWEFNIDNLSVSITKKEGFRLLTQMCSRIGFLDELVIFYPSSLTAQDLAESIELDHPNHIDTELAPHKTLTDLLMYLTNRLSLLRDRVTEDSKEFRIEINPALRLRPGHCPCRFEFMFTFGDEHRTRSNLLEIYKLASEPLVTVQPE